jgi:hypothetical protein
MSDRRDNEPLWLPPERDVTPQLRARVLHEALREDRKPARRPTGVGPILAGLAAAAVVVGVVVTFNHDQGDGTPATQQPSRQLVGEHDVVDTVVRAVSDRKIADLQQRCSQAAGIEAERRIASVRLRSPLGRIDAVVFGDRQAPRTRVFCSPFGVVTSVPPANIVSAGTPVKVVTGSRVQGLLPTRNDHEGLTAFYDGGWFATSPGVAQIEARLVIDGEAQVWHSAERVHGFVFATTWAALADDQLAQDITVEFRAISVDGTLLPMPTDVASSTVTPSLTEELAAHRDDFPALGQ